MLSFGSGIGFYTIKTLGHNNEWIWYHAIGHGFLTSLEGAISFGVGALSDSLVIPSTLIGKITKKYVEAVFGEPFNWLIDLIMEHLL